MYSSRVIACNAADVADEINSLHQQAVENLSSAAEIAAEIGSRLDQIKQQLPHGQFQAWVADKCVFSYATANAYMKVSKVEHAQLSPNSSIRQALAAIASDPDKKPVEREEHISIDEDGNAKTVKRGRSWREILESFARRKRVSFAELSETVGMKNDEKVKRYATQWQDASGLVVEKDGDGLSIKAGGDAIVAIFERLPSRTKTVTLQKLHLDEDMVEKKFEEFKRNNQTPSEHISGVLYKVNDLLHGIVQQYRNKERSLRGGTEKQSSDLIRIQSSIESLVHSVHEILIEGIGNGVSKK